MAGNNGAEQFSAFAALTGFDDIIREHEKITEMRREPSEDMMNELAEKMGKVRKGESIKAVYYGKDVYETVEGTVTDIDFVYRILKIERKRIPFDDIADIEICK